MEKTNCAPIALFVYNRLEHTKKTVDALKKNVLANQSVLYIFSDGPKTEEQVGKVEKVREYIKSISGFKRIYIYEKEENKGLAESIIDGVTQVLSENDSVIVMEDDLITSKFFLKYMNDALNKYEKNKKVYSITGYSHLDRYQTIKRHIPETYFLRLFCSWSWATWKDRWKDFDEYATGWENVITDKKMSKDFDLDNTFDMSHMLINQMTNSEYNSWAIRWAWSIYKKEGVTLFPRDGLCDNIGFDGTGVHCGTNNNWKQSKLEDYIVTSFPAKSTESRYVRKKLAFLKKMESPRCKIKRMVFYLTNFQELKQYIIRKLGR